MEILICVLLGIIQGLTEFLPVSSSGHLALAEQILGVQPRLHLAAALHLATLAVVIVWFRNEIKEIFADLPQAWKKHRAGTGWGELARTEGGFRTALLVVVACVPTAVIGLVIESSWSKLAGSAAWVSGFLILTGVLLFVTRFARAEPRSMTFAMALFVGVAQGVSVLPGISRSGATIAAALLLGAARKEAATFSFLIAVPAILGACILEGRHLSAVQASFLPALVAGMVASAAVGYLALKLLITTVTRGRLSWYSAYVIPLGLAGMVYAFVSK